MSIVTFGAHEGAWNQNQNNHIRNILTSFVEMSKCQNILIFLFPVKYLYKI